MVYKNGSIAFSDYIIAQNSQHECKDYCEQWILNLIQENEGVHTIVP